MKIAFIGGGNMATALIGGLIAQETPPASIVVYDTDTEKLARLGKTHGVGLASCHADAVTSANCVIFAIKPQQFEQAARQTAPALAKDTLVLSVAAGILADSIFSWLGQPFPVVRAMPNLAALIGAGVTGLWASQRASATQKMQAENILKSVGAVVWLTEERLLDVVTAVSGSGPAYYFYLMETIEKTAVALGLDNAVAHRLVAETALGAAKLAQHSTLTFGEQRAQVTSKGGTTEAALQVLQAAGFEQTVQQAIRAATARAALLSKTFLGA